MTVRAILKAQGLSPKRLRPLVNEVRGQNAQDILNSLRLMPGPAASCVAGAIRSAIANAENNKQLNIDNLFVKEAFVGKSLSMKRFRPRAKGRASSIIKPFSKLTIIVEERKNVEKGNNK